jgi:hypothetical protein
MADLVQCQFAGHQYEDRKDDEDKRRFVAFCSEAQVRAVLSRGVLCLTAWCRSQNISLVPSGLFRERMPVAFLKETQSEQEHKAFMLITVRNRTTLWCVRTAVLLLPWWLQYASLLTSLRGRPQVQADEVQPDARRNRG